MDVRQMIVSVVPEQALRDALQGLAGWEIVAILPYHADIEGALGAKDVWTLKAVLIIYQR